MSLLLTIASWLGALLLFEHTHSSLSLSIIGRQYKDLNETEDETKFAEEVSHWIPTGNLTEKLYAKYSLTSFQMGGIGICDLYCTFTRIYSNLPAHDIIYFDLNIVINRNWGNNDTALLEFDSSPFLLMYEYIRTGTNNMTVYTHGKVFHTGSSLNATLIINKNSPVFGAIGIRNFNLNFLNKTIYETKPLCTKKMVSNSKTSFCGQCPERHYRHANGSCLECDPSCISCYGSKPSECSQYTSDPALSGVRCSVSYYTNCSSYNQCNTDQYFEYSDQTWLGTCDPGSTPVQQLYPIQSCNTTCADHECLYPDGRCSTQCDYPLKAFVRYNQSFCQYPCSKYNTFYSNGSCIKYCDFPLVLKNYTYGPVCERRCNDTHILSYDNTTCIPSCPYPSINKTNEYGSYCEFPCTGSEILYHNGSCLGSCGPPLILNNYSFGRTCELPCNDRKILSYDNSTCETNCSYPFSNITNEYGYFCGFPCSGSEILFYNGSCLGSCGYPLVQRNETYGQMCELPCNDSKIVSYNGTECLTECSFPFTNMTNQYGHYCGFPCSGNDILYYNGSCLGSCGYPLVQRNETFGKICELRCILTEYFDNITCSADCAYPYGKKTNQYGNFCGYKCSDNKILYENGSCLGSCDYPSKRKDYIFGPICEHLCYQTTGLLSYYNSSCENTCSFPFVKKTNHYGSFCAYGGNCTSSEILLFNNICMPFSSCVTPLYRTPYPKFEICNNGCNPSEYIHWNSTCRSSCQYPFHERFQWGLKYCDGPLCGNVACPRCQKSSECWEEYYCNQFLGGFCMKKVVYLNPELSKTIINGYVITAEANPKIEIQEHLDDFLEVYLEDLVVNVDYKITIQKEEKAVFKINILLLKPLTMNSILANFKYSPHRLDVRADLTLSKIVFIPQDTLKKGKQVGNASELSFILLIISLVVFMVLGKVSNMISFVMINQYLHALLYLDANYLEHTVLYLRSLKNYNAILSINKDKEEMSFAATQKLKASLPKRFFEEEYSTSFFSNSIQIVGILSLTFIVLVIISALLRFLKSRPKFLQKIMFSLRWNGLIRQIITYSLPLTIAALVQVHVSVFGRDRDIFPLLASLLCLFLFFVLFFRMFFVIERIPFHLSERVLYADKYGALWKGLDVRSSGRYYYWLSSMRGLLLAYVAIFCDLFPFIQTSFLVGFQCIILSLFFKRFRFHRVMAEKDQNFVSFVLEFSLLMEKCLILSNWVLSQLFIDEEILIMIGWGIIAVGVFIQMTQASYSLYMQIKNWRKILGAIKSLCKPKKRKVRRIAPDKCFQSSANGNRLDLTKKL